MQNSGTNYYKFINVIFFTATIVLIILLRLHFIEEPFERDLTIYSYIAHRMLEGDLLYSTVWDHKPPGVYCLYMLAELFGGYGPSAVVYLGIVFTIISHLFIFFLLKKIDGVYTAFAGSVFWVFASNSILMQANLPNVEVFLNTFTLMAIWSLIKYLDKGAILYLLLSGLFFAVGSIFKTVIIFPYAAVFLYLLFQTYRENCESSIKKILIKLFIFLLPGALIWTSVFLYFGVSGRFNDMLEAIFFVNYNYVRRSILLNIFRFFSTPSLLFHESLSDILSLVIFSFAWFFFCRPKYGLLRRSFFVFLLFGLWVEVASAGNYFPHYYQVLIPVFCILSALFLSDFARFLKAKSIAHRTPVVLLLFSIATGYLFYYQLMYLEMDGIEVSKKKYGSEFVQSYELGSYIKSQTNRCEKIFVWGSDPGIYYYSKRDSASNVYFIYSSAYLRYQLRQGRPMALLKRKTKLMRDIRSTPPSFIIWNNNYGAIVNNILYSFIKENFKFVTKKHNKYEIWEYKFRKKMGKC